MGCTQSTKTNLKNELKSLTNENMKEQKPVSTNIVERAKRSFSVASNNSNNSYMTSTYTGHFYDVTTNLTNVELIKTINWIEKYKPNANEFKILKEDALTEYKEKIKNQLAKYFNNIHLKYDVQIHTDKTIYTTIPEDHFSVINICINTVNDNLGYLHTKEIVLISLQLLREEIRTIYDKLEIETFEISTLSAFVNDYIRMKMLCGNLNEMIFRYESDNLTNELFDMFINELPNDYERLIDKLLEEIVKKMFVDFNKIFFSKLFTKAWKEINANIFVATLEDYLSDLLIWLNCKYHEKILLMIVSEFLVKYMFTFDNRKDKDKENVFEITEKIKNDTKIITTFFIKMNISANKFEILNNIVKILLCKIK